VKCKNRVWIASGISFGLTAFQIHMSMTPSLCQLHESMTGVAMEMELDDVETGSINEL
jgi:hypothetical protein